MAGFGGFLQGLGVAAGNNMIYGQEQAEKQAITEERQQRVAMQKMQMNAMQQHDKTSKDVGDFIKSQEQADASIVQDPIKLGQLYETAAAKFASSNDFEGAKTMEGLAKGKRADAAAAATELAQKKLQLNDDLAGKAFAYSDAPTPETASALAQAAVAAGVNPLTIPKPGPQFDAWAKAKTTASMSNVEKVKAAEKITADAKKAEFEKTKFIAEEKDKAATRSETARYHSGELALSSQRVALERARTSAETKRAQVQEIGDALYERDTSGKIPGDRPLDDKNWVKIGEKLSSQQKQGVSRIAFSGSEITRSLDKVMKMDPGAASSPFEALGKHTLLEALTTVGTRSLTPAQSKMLSVTAAGLGNQIAGMESALGGRMAAGAQQQHLQDMTIPAQGDDGYTALYKLANTKEIAITAIENAPGHYARTAEGIAKIKALNEAVPFTTDKIIEMTRKDPEAKKSASTIRRMATAMDDAHKQIAERASVGGDVSATPAGAPALPAGWSVKEH